MNYENDLEHSWGKSPEQKAREKEYNQQYYKKNKAKWKKYARNAVNAFNDATGVTTRNIKNEAKAAYDKDRQLYDLNQEFQRTANSQSKKAESNAARKMGEELNLEKTARESATEYHKILDWYKDTPLGKVEYAAKAGKKAVDNAINSLRNLKLDIDIDVKLTKKK